MKTKEVLSLLDAHKDERGIAHWNKRCAKGSKLKSFGIGLTKLRKLAKQIGRDHALALELWKSDFYEAKIIALLIDDPRTMTPAQVRSLVAFLPLLGGVFAGAGLLALRRRMRA